MTARCAAPVLALWLASSLHAAPVEPQPLHRYEASRMSMACEYAIEAYGRDAEALPPIGGIAKGYAVDRVGGLLKRRQIAAALISAGGSTIYGLGARPGADGWKVKLQDPIDPQKIAFTIKLKDRALSVAGSSEKAFEAGGVLRSGPGAQPGLSESASEH